MTAVCAATLVASVDVRGGALPEESGLGALLARSPYVSTADIERHCGIESISLERTPYAGEGWAYVVTFFRNGNVEYEGNANVRPRGRRHGVIAPREFARLCQIVAVAQFDGYAAAYNGSWFHGATAYVTVVEHAMPRTVSDYDESGPIGLWTLERVMDAIANRVDWQRGPGSASPVRRAR